MADKTMVDNPEVGTLDTQNTAENTVENTGQNEINSTKPDKASPETDENTLSVSTNDVPILSSQKISETHRKVYRKQSSV